MAIQKLSPALFIGVAGKGIISFGSGQPDLPPPKRVFKALNRYKYFKYGLIQGQLNLREALAVQYPGSTADSFVITSGASEAIDLTLRALSKIGSRAKNRVLLTKPYYYSYPHIVKAANMKPVYTDLTDGQINLDDFKKKIKGCKAVIINSPSNPTGRVESPETLKRIKKLTRDLGVYVLTDEVYKDLVYVKENYLVRGHNVIVIDSFSKTYAMCGLRIGYLWSLDREVVHKITEIKTHTSMNTNILGQEMAYEATKVPRSFVSQQLKIWRERRDLIYERMLSMNLNLWKPEGAFYVLPKIKNSEDFAWNMFKRYKVITYPGEWFGAKDRVRFSYALDVNKIEEGLRRVRKYLEKEGRSHLIS